jgi:hypothetical protein
MVASTTRERLWPIWLWIILFVVVAGCGLLGSLYQRTAGQKELARLIVQQELLQNHWVKLEADGDFRSIIKTLASATKSDAGVDWSARFVRASGAGAAATDRFEDQALKIIETGTDEVWQQSWRGVTRYARAIRAKPECISCHPSTGVKFIQVNDVIGVISIEIGSAPDGHGAAVALSTGAP